MIARSGVDVELRMTVLVQLKCRKAGCPPGIALSAGVLTAYVWSAYQVHSGKLYLFIYPSLDFFERS